MSGLVPVACSGLAVTAFVVLALSGAARRPGGGPARARVYLSLVLLQAGLICLKDFVEGYYGQPRLAAFLIYADFLFGLPALYLFFKATFDERPSRPWPHFLPFLVNLVPAALAAKAGFDSIGIDGELGSGLASPALIYVNLLAAAETLQLAVYAHALFRLLRRRGGDQKAAAFRVVAKLGCLGYAGYYALRWAGFALRLARSGGGSLAPTPAWVRPLSVCLVSICAAVAGLYVLARSELFFRGPAREPGEAAPPKAKYGGKPLDPREAERLIGRARAALASREDLCDERANPRGLALELGVPYYLLSRAVNEGLGCTIAALIQAQRIERAKFLLESSDAPILEVALESGFSAKSSFNAAFKSALGLRPSEYRAKVRGS